MSNEKERTRMPHALTDRQREYLDFLRDYIRENRASPRLNEIAEHFYVQPPTAHKMLKTLQSKGYLYFGRDSVSGFFIRLIERAGSAETVMEVPIIGDFNAYGEVVNFPEKQGHFASVFSGGDPETIFAIGAIDDIPHTDIVSQDLIIFEMGKVPKPGDICIAPIGKRWFLIKIASKTSNKRLTSPLVAQEYPIPEDLEESQKEKPLHWYPLAWTEDKHEFFLAVTKEQNFSIAPLHHEILLGTAMRLTRALTF